MTYYLPSHGTWAKDDGWVVNPTDPFTQFMATEGFYPLRTGEKPWTWSGKLNGFLFSFWRRDWVAASHSLEAVLQNVPYEHRNIIGHSFGGVPPLLLAGRGFPLRSLTTIATPRRHDVDADRAALRISVWQHVYDSKRDFTATLRRMGGIGDGTVSLDRSYDIPGVINLPIGNIDHSKLLHDPTCFYLWKEHKILDRIRVRE